MMESNPIVMRGWLGWGNCRGPLDAYGPGGRWFEGPQVERYKQGDHLPDALKRHGAREGMHLIVIALDRFTTPEKLKEIENLLAEKLNVEPVRSLPETSE